MAALLQIPAITPAQNSSVEPVVLGESSTLLQRALKGTDESERKEMYRFDKKCAHSFV